MIGLRFVTVSDQSPVVLGLRFVTVSDQSPVVLGLRLVTVSDQSPVVLGFVTGAGSVPPTKIKCYNAEGNKIYGRK